MTEKSSYRRIGAVRTALEILDKVAEDRNATARGIADSTGLPYGTVMSHLATLADAGFIKMDGECFRIGQKLAVYWAMLRTELQAEHEKIKNALAALG